MRGSSFTTFLMFLPLVAIPLLAIFGIPEFTPVNASSPSDAVRDGVVVTDLESAAARDRNRTSQGANAESAEDLFRPFQDQNGQSRPDPFLQKSGRMHGWELDPRRTQGNTGPQPQRPLPRVRRVSANRTETASPFPGPPRSQPAEKTDLLAEVRAEKKSSTQAGEKQTDARQPAGLTWQGAVARLNRLGIHNFALQPGVEPGEFHFSCTHADRDNPRVIRRFEAEDTDPLAAVQKVLRQVERRRAFR